MAALLEVENLSVRYGDLVALRSASLSVDEGEVVCIIGPNGAGKSTTLAAIAGGVRPVSGDIRLDGRSIVGRRPEHVARLRLSLVPEGRHIFGTLTVEENLQIGGYMLGEQALGLGLIDGFSTVDELVRDLGGARARPRRFAPRRQGLLSRLPRLGIDALLDALEDRRWGVSLR